MEEVSLPLEFIVRGTARAHGADTAPAWRALVVTSARAALPENSMLLDGPLAVTIYHFPTGAGAGDVDNIVKPILDALTRVVYFDDEQVERVLVQRFPFQRTIVVEDPSNAMIEALETEPPIVFIRIHRNLDLLES